MPVGRRHRSFARALMITALALAVVAPAADAAPKTKRVSVSQAGVEGNDRSNKPSLSKTGRFVAFHSEASNLEAGPDANVGGDDVFLRDNRSRKVHRISISSSGVPGNDVSRDPVVSADGRFVAFWSRANTLIGSDGNSSEDVFIRDRKKSKTKRLSVSSGGKEGNDDSRAPSISASGRYVAFESRASNLVKGDTKGYSDIFVKDRKTKRTRRVSVRSNGREANGGSFEPVISANGRFIVFASAASNLVKNDDNGFDDIFIHDRVTKRTSLVSVKSNGKQTNDGASFDPWVSADGRFVVFGSEATNLVKNDDNEEDDVFLRDRKLKKTFLISKARGGGVGDGFSDDPVISGNGRWIVFDSGASDLIRSDTNDRADTFIYDRKTKKTKRLSVKTGGGQADGGTSSDVTISQDGRFAAFDSTKDDLVPVSANTARDVYRRGPLR